MALTIETYAVAMLDARQDRRRSRCAAGRWRRRIGDGPGARRWV